MYLKYVFFLWIYMIFCFSSCQYLKFGESPPATNNNKGAKTKASVFMKKLWIRETFLKDFTRPSIAQSIKPVLTDTGLLVQGNKTNGIGAYTLDKGKKKWFFPVKGGLAGDVLISDEFVFFGGSDGFVYALYLNTGKVLWKKYYTGLTGVSAPVVKNKYLYFVSANKIYCLNRKTGDNIWSYSSYQVRTAELTIEGVGQPLVSDSLIYFKSSDGSLVALNLKGQLKWKRELSNPNSRFTSASSAPVMGKTCLYSSSLESGLYCLDKKTGRVIWKTATGSHGDLLLSGSQLFYSTHDGRILALDQKSGKQIWNHKVPRSIATAPVLYKNVLIYGEYSGSLRAVSIDTGKEMDFFFFGNGMSAPPAVLVMDSVLYFMSNTGWLYKLQLYP